MSAQARARRLRRKRDPYSKQVKAVSVPMPPVVCAICGFARLLHPTPTCTEYVEIPEEDL